MLKLGFDAIKFNMSCYKSELSGNNEEGFCLVNSAKVEAVCKKLVPSGCDKYEVERVGCLELMNFYFLKGLKNLWIWKS